MQRFTLTRGAVLFAAMLSTAAIAQTADGFSLKDAAQAAVLKSPDVLARWHAFREADEEVGVARGGFLPRVDLSAGVGREKTVQKQIRLDATYSGNENTLSLRQMLFDGFATANEVKRLGRAKLVRYFELLDASENVALEAGRAYLDVLRFRAQVELSEENYLQHQAAYEQLRKRAESGVGKRVDVDQAASRLALADVNLTTAYANLHDVTARYVRIVGEQPPRTMPPPAGLTQALPASADAALAEALKHNPALRASIENTEASQYDLEARRSAFMPRLDLVARRDGYSNYQDAGARTDSRVELRLNFNLFNGGSDAARSRQYRERKNIALDMREKACRDMRQTLSIAYNETRRLNEQIPYIATQVGLVEKTRAAYRDQFNIGQRTLLDLLNTQNEYFDARRSQVNADADVSIAALRSYAGMGRLLETIGLKQVDAENAPEAADFTPVDLTQLCPSVTPIDTTLDRAALNRKVKETLAASGSFTAPKPTAPVIAAPESAEKPAAPASAELAKRTAAWASAWAARDSAAYLAYYAASFTPEGGSNRADWAKQREQRLAAAGKIRIEIQDLTVHSTGVNTAETRFRQTYAANNLSDITEKTLEWRKEAGQWLIVRETARPVTAR